MLPGATASEPGPLSNACRTVEWCTPNLRATVSIRQCRRNTSRRIRLISWFGRNELPIFIEPRGFTAQCGPLESTIFHEVSHFVFDLHEIGDGSDDPQDEVYGCERTCFGKATSQTCAQCIGKKNGTPTCRQYPEVPCTADVPTLCTCDKKIYLDELECHVECPSGLACFFEGCAAHGPCR
jgi:hypothetical protein